MPSEQAAPLYRIWGTDKIVYGPFELPALVDWVNQARVTAGTWVFVEESGRWHIAGDLPELRMFFGSKPPGAGSAVVAPSKHPGVKAENLRRMRILAEMDTRQLESFLVYLETVRLSKFAHLFKKGDDADSMFFVLEGEVRAKTVINGKETTLFTMKAGESFGETALLSQGPRAADVVANEDTLLLKLPAEAFEKIIREAPALATPFLLAIARVVTVRSLELGKKFERSIRSARVVAGISC